MRPLLSLKVLLRAPIRTLLILLLIAATSFSLFSRVTDYAATQREMTRAISFYRGVSALDTGVPNTGMLLGSFVPNTVKHSTPKELPAALTQKQITAFSSLPGVTGTDTRYMTAGIAEGLDRVVRYEPYEQIYDYTDRFVVEGTIAEVVPGKWGGSDVNFINLTDFKQLAGALPIEQGGDVSIIAFIGSGVALTHGDMKMYFYLSPNPYQQEFADSLAVGERCVMIGRWDPRYLYDIDKKINSGKPYMNMYIGDQDTIDICDSYLPLAGKPENYLETEEFSVLRQIIDITNRDLKTFDIVYTSDLLSIPRFNEGSMVIKEGRAIKGEKQDVCVVNYAFAEINKLKIGDKIAVDLCGRLLPQHSEMGATAVIPERYGDIVKTAELEIVGIYADVDPAYNRIGSMWWSYSPNTIFVPKSLLPVEVPDDHPIYPGEFSVVIDDAYSIQAFLNSAKPAAKNMGLSLHFSDKGWLSAMENLDISQGMSLLTTVLFICASAVALLLAVYLFTQREKKNFAIMRALGTPQRKARQTLALPLFALSALAIAVGGMAGTLYASNAIRAAAEKLAASITLAYIPDTSLPVGAMLLCLLCEMGFLLFISALFLRSIAKTPPLLLLQGEGTQVKGKKAPTQKKSITEMPRGEIIPIIKHFAMPEMPERGIYSAARHMTRYILRHMRRATWKTALIVILSTMLTGVCGLLAMTRLAYRELFDATTVTGTLTNYSSDAISEAAQSELMENFYFCGGFSVLCNEIYNNTGHFLAVTNDFDRYIRSKSDIEYTVHYADGCDASFFAERNESKCIIGNFVSDVYGVNVGGTITLYSWEAAYYLAKLYPDENEFYNQLKRLSREFTVVGIVNSDDPNISLGVFVPLSETVEQINPNVAYSFAVEFAEFTLADKENPQVLLEYLDELSNREYVYTETMSYHMDTAEIEHIKSVRDMLVVLFPIALAAAVLIGLIASGLIIMQSAKEAAMLRVLGTTKMRTRCVFAIEQISLCAAGMIIAALALTIYDAGLFARCAGVIILCEGLYLFGCVWAVILAAVQVTRGKVLELLQVKE